MTVGETPLILLMFLKLLLCVTFYCMVCTIDILVASFLEKKGGFYPMLEFTCFCGWHQTLIGGPQFLPNQTYHFHKVRKHTKSCLVWIFNADFNQLEPYWAHSYAKDLRDYEKNPTPYLTPEYFLKAAKQRSARVRAGASPWDDTFETMDDDMKRRKGYKI